MALKNGLRSLLLADTDIAAAVGNRVRVDRQPKGSDYPAIVFRYVASEYITTLKSVNATQMRRVQFNCWGKTPKEADELAQALHNLLDGYRGALPEGTCVSSCLPSGDVDLTDEELQLAGIAVDFNIWFVPANFVVTPGGPITVPEFVWDIDDVGEPQEDPPLEG